MGLNNKLGNMKIHMILLVFVFIAISMPVTEVAAQRSQLQKGALKSKWDSASPDQKNNLRKQLRKHYDSLPSDEKEKIRQRILEKVDSLSPEQKKNLRQQLRKRKGGKS